jgi:hypothetical protein
MKSLARWDLRNLLPCHYLLTGTCYTTHSCAGEEYCLRNAANSNQKEPQQTFHGPHNNRMDRYSANPYRKAYAAG